MLSSIKMIKAVNENFNGGLYESAITNVPAMDLSQLSVVEAFSAARMAVMEEAASFRQTVVQSDEIMTEAVLNGTFDDVMSESVFSAIAEKAKKVIDKIIAAVKGLIERIKAFFFKLTGKTDKWIEVMKPRLENARRSSDGRSNITYNMHSWDQTYMKGISGNIGKLVNDWSNEDDVSGITFDEIKKMAEDAAKEAPEEGKYDASTDSIKKINTAYADAKDKDRNEAKDELLKNLKSYFGVDAADRSDLVAAINKKCMNGSTEKTDVKVAGIVDSAWTAVDGAANYRSDLIKVYTDYLKKLEEFKKSINKSTDFKFPDSDGKSATYLQNVRTMAQNAINNAVWITEQYEGVIQTIQQTNMSALNTMVQEYMGAITAYCNKKPAKKED